MRSHHLNKLSLNGKRSFHQELAHPHFEEVLTKKHNHGMTVTLNRPKALNSLNLPMIRHLTPLYQKWEKDDSIASIVVKGEGRAFCAGGDIVHIYESGMNKTTDSQDFFFEEYILNYLIGTLKTPHIAILNGITMGGGVGLSVHGKFRVATENTLFAMPETGIGFFPDVGGTYFLPRLQDSLGTFLALTGYRLKGKAVRAAGIATHYIPAAHLDEVEGELSQIKKKDDARVNEVLQKYSQDCKWGDTELSQEILDLIHRVFSRATVEEIVQGLQKEKHSEFAHKQLQTLKRMSPLSLKITHQQMHKGKHLSLKQALELEYAISQNFMKGHDFYEGVRELLVTKTNAPKWKPATLEEITDEEVNHYFHYTHDMKHLDLSNLKKYNRVNDSKL